VTAIISEKKCSFPDCDVAVIVTEFGAALMALVRRTSTAGVPQGLGLS